MSIASSKLVITRKEHRCYICRHRFRPQTIMASWVSIPTDSGFDFCHGYDCLPCHYTLLAAQDEISDYEFLESLFEWHKWDQEKKVLTESGIEERLTHWSRNVREAAVEEARFLKKRFGLSKNPDLASTLSI